MLRHGQQADQDQHRARIADSAAQTCAGQNVVDGSAVTATVASQQLFRDPAGCKHARSRDRTCSKRSRCEHGDERCGDKAGKFDYGIRDYRNYRNYRDYRD
ncbi:hypothetical protein GCM10011400_54570 [Paraburkholderia caffeinilytica]|uniref:Uncharacterized protein n=1 Tax=Paraburkholderia caffeinilytica TaxID=1761016 RepID=A0ABQ1N8G4_9BURK|nr:hypothetical protein GCM10011400_54570 [Paraburkholderia caffeinilytica]